MLATLMVSSTMMAGNVKKSTTLPIEGEIVKASHPMIQYVGRVSFAKNPDVASFNYPGTTIEASFQGSSLKMLCRPKTGYFMAQIDGCELFKVGFNAERDSVVTLAAALPKGVHHAKVMYVIEAYSANRNSGDSFLIRDVILLRLRLSRNGRLNLSEIQSPAVMA